MRVAQQVHRTRSSAPGGTWARKGSWNRRWNHRKCRRKECPRRRAVHAVKGAVEEGRDRKQRTAAVSAVIVSGVLNLVTHKLALVPLANHIFFLAQFMTVSYVLIYSITLYVRYKRGWVTQEMLDVPKKTLVLAGMFEAVGLTLGLLGASGLPGAVLPVFSQLILIWQLILSYTLLGRRYPFTQLLGIAMVAMGVATTTNLGTSTATLTVPSCARYLCIYILSLGCPAMSILLKEKVFSDFRREKEKDLDLFVVNTFSSFSQGISVLLFLPVISRLQGVMVKDIPSYMIEGLFCFFGQGNRHGLDSTGAPFFPLLYVAMNLCFNVSVLRLVRLTSSVLSSMVMATTVPLTILAFMFHLPLLPKPQPVGPLFWPGVWILLAGLAVYNLHDASLEGIRGLRKISGTRSSPRGHPSLEQ